MLKSCQNYVGIEEAKKAVIIILIVTLTLVFGQGGCGSSNDGNTDSNNSGTSARTHFAVVSDPHVYDRALGVQGPDFDAYVGRNMKLLEQSEAIFAQVIDSLKHLDEPPAFLLIPGDLTKDGEKQSHRLVASYLTNLRASGIQPYIIPGNHDVANPEAVRYDESGSTQVYSPDAEAFVEIYSDFGYDQAIFRDPHSLSYVAEPAPGLWLFAVDTNRYDENEEYHVVGGHIRAQTLEWLVDKLRLACESGKEVIGMMHHGMMEHFQGQGEYLTEFIVDDWERMGHLLASEGMNLVFTGHWHAQNITRREWDDEVFLVDVQTGSPITYPNPYRLITHDQTKGHVSVRTLNVDELTPNEYPSDAFASFRDYSYAFTRDNLMRLSKEILAEFSSLPEERIDELLPLATEALLAHLAGDEEPTLRNISEALALVNSSHPDERDVGMLLLSLWRDLPPGDNDVEFQLSPAVE